MNETDFESRIAEYLRSHVDIDIRVIIADGELKVKVKLLLDGDEFALDSDADQLTKAVE